MTVDELVAAARAGRILVAIAHLHPDDYAALRASAYARRELELAGIPVAVDAGVARDTMRVLIADVARGAA